MSVSQPIKCVGNIYTHTHIQIFEPGFSILKGIYNEEVWHSACENTMWICMCKMYSIFGQFLCLILISSLVTAT